MRAGWEMGMRKVLVALVALAIGLPVSAQSAPFQNGTTPTETSSLDSPVTSDDTFTAETVSTDSVSAAEETVSAAFKGGGGNCGDKYCSTKTVTETCTVTSTVCGKHCPGEKTTYVRRYRRNN